MLHARFWGGRFQSGLDRSGKAITGGRHWACIEGLVGSRRQRGRTRIFYSEKCEMWSKCSKISYFHYRFKTTSLEVLELKFPKIQPQRAPEAKLSYTNLFVQSCIAVEEARTWTFMSCWKWIVCIGPFFSFMPWSLQIEELVRKKVRKS